MGALAMAAGCSSGLSPAGTIQNDTAAVLDKANAGDVEGVHAAAAAMKSDIRSLSGRGKLSTAKAADLVATLNAIEANADSLKVAPAPSATSASPTDSPTPSPTATPSPSATPEPAPTTPPPTTPPPTTPPPTTPPPTKSPTPAPILSPTLGSAGPGGSPSASATS